MFDQVTNQFKNSLSVLGVYSRVYLKQQETNRQYKLQDPEQPLLNQIWDTPKMQIVKR